jgi:uncharacterized protein involved in type VI secretion and phage assembly
VDQVAVDIQEGGAVFLSAYYVGFPEFVVKRFHGAACLGDPFDYAIFCAMQNPAVSRLVSNST